MAKDKKDINPAAAQRKADKQKALKKGKAAVAAQRNERLAHRNPERLQTQIEDLRSLEASAGKLSARDKKTLEDLERDVVRVRKAKEAVGDKYAERKTASHADRGGREGGRGGRGGVLGKRGRDGEGRRERDREDASSDTDESVGGIPMPRDTPPPVPHRERRGRLGQEGQGQGSAANATPLGEGRGSERRDYGEQGPHALPQKPQAQAPQTVYESKAVVRDLRKEAVGFVPSAVRKKLDASKGGVGGRLLEEEELDKLEGQGYGKGAAVSFTLSAKEHAGGQDHDSEEERFRRELKQVQMEEAEDEGQ